jgi:Glucosyl transferase GtrII
MLKKFSVNSQVLELSYQSGLRLLRKYGDILGLLFVLQLITYSYFFSTIVFTNHTFPNSWVYPYPSFKTQGEGRWFADMIIWIQGGSGVQSFQMYLAVALQSINGILFANFLGIKRRLEILLVAAFLCLYPAFLDYYSFSVDHITFVIGDTLALSGITLCKDRPHSVKNAVVCSIFFVLSLASYQPKIALISLLCLLYLLTKIVDAGNSALFSWRKSLQTISYAACIFFGACLLYFISIKLTITTDIGSRTHINTLSEISAVTFSSFGAFIRYYTVESDYLPWRLRWLPLIGICAGALTLINRARKRHPAVGLLICVLLLLIPIALQSSYIINNVSWRSAGRLTFANGYALLFLLASPLTLNSLNALFRGLLATFIYFFIVIGTQESNAAAFKTIYDLNMLNRVAARIETVAENLYQKQYALVVIGHYPDFDRSRYIRSPNARNIPHVSSYAFEIYRQPQILDYFFGQYILVEPTVKQVQKAIASSKNRQPWPAKESVYALNDEIIVLTLEKYRPGIPVTSASDREK